MAVSFGAALQGDVPAEQSTAAEPEKLVSKAEAAKAPAAKDIAWPEKLVSVEDAAKAPTQQGGEIWTSYGVGRCCCPHRKFELWASSSHAADMLMCWECWMCLSE